MFAKHILGIKYYIRYTDDFIFVHKDKKYLENIVPTARLFLKEKLGLDLHPRKIILRKLSCGIDFLGYIILPYYKILRTKTKKRIMRKIKARVMSYNRGDISRKSLEQTLQSYLGVLKHCRSQKISDKFRQQLFKT